MGLIRTHYIDASAIVKLLVNEPCSNTMQSYFDRWSNFYTTSICFAEALGVLKAKCFYRKEIERETYFDACDHLMSLVSENDLSIDEISISDIKVFAEVERLCNKYSIDVSDSFQIYTLKHGLLSFTGETILITADKDLAQAIRKEGLKAWDCMNEPEP